MTIPVSIIRLQGRALELATLLEAWCNINSGSMNIAGLERMRGQLRTGFTEIPGVQVEEVTLAGTEAKALRVWMRPAAEKRVFLSGHYDTVYPPEHYFQRCEHIGEGRLRGPGVADMKGGLVVMLAALQAFERTPSAAKLGWEVLLNPDEEIGSRASAPLFAEAATRFDFGLVFEPARARGDLVHSRKGTGLFTVTCHGRTAHAQEAAAGRNAIVALSAFVQAATRLPAELPGVLLNVGRITGGGPATNVVPDLAEAVLDVRVTHMTDQAAVEERLRALVAELSTDGITFEISGGINRPPKECNATEAKAFAEWRRAGADLELVPFSWLHAGGGSDGSLLSAAGLPNLDGVGIVGDHMHSEREYCVLSSLVERAQLAALFLHRLASGEIEIGKPS